MVIAHLIVMAAAALAPQDALPSKSGIAWNRYRDYDELLEAVRQIAARSPDLVRIEQIGTSALGRPMVVAIVNNPATGPEASKPAMWIDGNIHGNEVQAGEVVGYTLDSLCNAHGRVPELTELIDRSVFYLCPSVNPDGRDEWFSKAHTPHSNRTGLQPFDNDRDGESDEDGPDDLDGDGSIGQMWRKDPNGTHRRDPRDPRRFIPVSREPRPDGTVERGEWSYGGEEGIDNDGDGRVNEDGQGGYDMNRNWPSDWQPDHVQRGAGPWPLSYPETRCIAEFILARPNIAAVQSYHNAGGMILRGPGAPYNESAYPASDRAAYDAIAAAGAQMLPAYRPMVIYKDLYTVHGGFVNWTAEGLGIVSFTNELWSDQRIMQTGQDPNDEERARWRDDVLFGRTFKDWTEFQHPTLGTVLVGGQNKWSSRVTPHFMLEEECHRNFAFTTFHASQMPLLRAGHTRARSLSEGVWELSVEVCNDRRIPTRTGRAADRGIARPDLLTVGLGDPAGAVVAGGVAEDGVLDRTFTPVKAEPARLRVERGIPGLGSTVFRFIIRAGAGSTARLRYESQKATPLELEVVLKETVVP
jgi:hypothetical protein